QNFGRSIIPMLVGRANETDPSYTTSMIIFAITALGAMFVAIAMLFVDRKKGYGLQKPNIKSEAN
ncbi:MAG: MFS transporter, partial [Prevotella sp.]|nr:MFS transporter [Prevotella sp.]